MAQFENIKFDKEVVEGRAAALQKWLQTEALASLAGFMHECAGLALPTDVGVIFSIGTMRQLRPYAKFSELALT